jgi:hypothetical protein
LIISAIMLIPQWVITIYEFAQPFRGGSSIDFNIVIVSFFLFFTVGFYVLIVRYFIFKTDWLIDKLYLDKGFTEERFELKIHRSTVLRIAVIVIGAVIIIYSLPLFCKQAFAYSQLTGPDKGFKENPASGWLIFYFVKLFVGFFMMTSSRLVVNFIERKRKDHVAVEQSTQE